MSTRVAQGQQGGGVAGSGLEWIAHTTGRGPLPQPFTAMLPRVLRVPTDTPPLPHHALRAATVGRAHMHPILPNHVLVCMSGLSAHMPHACSVPSTPLQMMSQMSTGNQQWQLLHVAIIALKDDVFIGRLFFGEAGALWRAVCQCGGCAVCPTPASPLSP